VVVLGMFCHRQVAEVMNRSLYDQALLANRLIWTPRIHRQYHVTSPSLLTMMTSRRVW
jgi:hypothetical protein